MKLKASHIIILFLLGVILFLRLCDKPCPDPEVEIEYLASDTVFDTIYNDVPVYVPEVVYQDTGSTNWLFHPVDTAKILAEFFTKNYYQDTIVNDTFALIIIRDTITQNRIRSREPLLTFFPATIHETTVVKVPEDPRVKLFVGFGVGRSIDQFGLSGNLMLINKRDQAYGFQYDFLNKDLYLSALFKLRLKAKISTATVPK